jgi:DNA-binding TFAR19-related protein (PDSD5 family)
MIRKDKTNYNPNTDSGNWTNTMFQDDAMTDSEKQKQSELMSVWEHTAKRRLTDSELAEWELARRISASSEDDTTEKRVEEARKAFAMSGIVEQKLADLQNSGQTPEDFEFEQEMFGRNYRKIVAQARKEVGL